MEHVTYNGKEYSVKTLRSIARQGIKLVVENEKLFIRTPLTGDETIVVAHGDNYDILIDGTGGTLSKEGPKTFNVRMISKVILKKALKQVIAPVVYRDPLAHLAYRDKRDNRGYENNTYDRY